MRFTPEQTGCQLKAGRVYSYFTGTGTPRNCSLFVCDNNSGVPGTVRVKQSYTPSTNDWDRIDLTLALVYDTDFWIGIWIPEYTTTNMETVTFDDECNEPARKKARNPSCDWRDAIEPPGDIMLRAIVDYEGIEETYTAEKKIVLKQNVPNPVFRETKISYILPKNAEVKLEIYNSSGRVVKTIVNSMQSAGVREILWDRKNQNNKLVPAGVYFYRLNVDRQSFTKTMIVL